jgi:hypothetical protein
MKRNASARAMVSFRDGEAIAAVPPPAYSCTMPRTTQCPACQTVLNIPAAAGAKRLKCPKCATRFYADGGARPPSSTESTERDRRSSVLLTPPGRSEVDLPVAEGDLGETFGADLLMDEDPRPPSRPRGTSDAAALFDDRAGPRRTQTAADMRSKARRCPSCTTVVPAGMALCPRCDLNLETGQREIIDDFLDEAPVAPAPSGPPFGVLLIGTGVLLGSLALALLALLKLEGTGGMLLALVCLFGVAAAVQFLRGRTAKLMVAALMLAAGIDVIALIVLPVYKANSPEIEATTTTADDDDAPKIKAYQERLEINKIYWGIGLLLGDAALMIYLSTGGVRRHFERTPTGIPGPLM